VLLFLSLRFALFPVKPHFPFINSYPSTYALVHDTYLRLSLDRPLLGRPKSRIKEEYSRFADGEAVRASITSRQMRYPDLEPAMIRSFTTFKSAHSAIFDLSAKYGLPALLLFLAAQGVLIWGYLKRFGPGLETQIVILSTYRYFFSDPSRASMALFFVQAGYLVVSERRRQ